MIYLDQIESPWIRKSALNIQAHTFTKKLKKRKNIKKYERKKAYLQTIRAGSIGIGPLDGANISVIFRLNKNTFKSKDKNESGFR
jgi:hypothetical protein